MAAAPGYKGMRLTSYTEDDGTDIGQLHWSPDGKSLLYVRGGDLEFLGRADPNPVANPDGTEQAIWIVSSGEKPPSRLTCSIASSLMCVPVRRAGPRR